MKIAFFNKELPSDRPNGVSCQVDRLASELASRGHDLTCFSFSPKPQDAQYKYVRLAYGSGLKILRKFTPAVQFRSAPKGEFDILHYHGDDYLSPGSRKRIRTFYGSALDEGLHAAKTSRRAYQLLFYVFEWVSCVREGQKAGISVATTRALPLVHNVIPCGVPLDRYVPGNTKSQQPTILFVGDFNSRKRGSLLLKAFREEILPRHPTCELVIIGPESCEEHSVTCISNINETELVKRYQRAWVYCMPSSYEGFGVPAIESMACGTPVVATENAGIKEIVTDNQNGIICTNTNLGTALNRVIDSMDLQKRLVENGLATVRSRFSIGIVADRYLGLYNAAIGA